MSIAIVVHGEDLKKAEVLANGLKVFRCVSSFSGKPMLKMWKPKAVKPYVYYVFKTEEERNCYFDKKVKEFEEIQTIRKQWRDERKSAKDSAAASAKVGDIFVKNWGYSMILVDFYQLISKTSKQGTFRELKTMNVSGDGQQGRCIATKWQFVENSKEFTASLGKFEKWDGSPQSFDHCD